MKTLYLECAMGAAGDMLTAALLELTGDRQSFMDRMNAIGLPGVTLSIISCETDKDKYTYIAKNQLET